MPPKKKDDLVQVFATPAELLEQRLQLAQAETRTLLETFQVETKRLQAENVLLRGQLLQLAEVLAGPEGDPEVLLTSGLLVQNLEEFVAGDREVSAELDRRGEQILDVRAFLESLEHKIKKTDDKDLDLGDMELQIRKFLNTLGGPLPPTSSKVRLAAIQSALKDRIKEADRQVQGHQQGSGAQQKWSDILGKLQEVQRAGWPEGDV